MKQAVVHHIGSFPFSYYGYQRDDPLCGVYGSTTCRRYKNRNERWCGNCKRIRDAERARSERRRKARCNHKCLKCCS